MGQGGDRSDYKYVPKFSWNDLSFHLYLRHIIYAPARDNQYGATGFPAITDAIASGNATEITNQVAIATYFLRGAISTLKEFNNFFA